MVLAHVLSPLSVWMPVWHDISPLSYNDPGVNISYDILTHTLRYFDTHPPPPLISWHSCVCIALQTSWCSWLLQHTVNHKYFIQQEVACVEKLGTAWFCRWKVTGIDKPKRSKNSRGATSQCEPALHCNAGSHWLGAHPEWSLQRLWFNFVTCESSSNSNT